MCELNEKLYEKCNEWKDDNRLFEEIRKKSKFLNSFVVNECEEKFHQSSIHVSNKSSYELETMDVIRQGNVDIALETLHNDIIRFVSEQYDTTITNILQALYVPEGVMYKTHTVDSDDIITMENILDGIYKIGDESNELKISMFHPKISRQIKDKIDPEDYKKKTGMKIIECDVIPSLNFNSIEKYFSFLIGKNSIYFKKTFFDIKLGEDPMRGSGTYYVHINTEFYLYLHGIVFNFNKHHPTNEELSNSNNWARVTKHDKDIKIIGLLTPMINS
jgi:hypothetical protein